MSGCFGSSKEDQARESQLMDYLEKRYEGVDDTCIECGCYEQECECE